jgi:hypothetical protein
MKRCYLLLSLVNLTVGGVFVCNHHNKKSQNKKASLKLRRSGIMKLTTLTVAFAAVTIFTQAAQAHEHHHRRHRAYHHVARSYRGLRMEAESPYAREGFGFGGGEYRAARLSGGVGPRPAAWCGWAMRQLVGGDPGASFNLARNWAHWGRSGPAGIGAVVVWPHHVGKIVGRENGQWVIESGNDGHALRTRARSIGGAIAIRWG